jgi:hypothetical protein
MNALEDKAVSRALAKKAGVPIPPGSEGVVDNEQDALIVAKRIGYPVMIKASAGGGGKGMRVVWEESEIEKMTIRYIRDHYKFTAESDAWFRTEIRKWAATRDSAPARKIAKAACTFMKIMKNLPFTSMKLWNSLSNPFRRSAWLVRYMKRAHNSGQRNAITMRRTTRRCWNSFCHANRGSTVNRVQWPVILP